MQKVKEALAKSYQDSIKNYFLKYQDNNSDGPGKKSIKKQEKVLIASIEQYVRDREDIIQKWTDTPLDKMKGKTPGDVIMGITAPDTLLDIFVYMADNTDEIVPPVLIKRLKDFRNLTVPRLYMIAKENQNMSGKSGCQFSAAVSALGSIGHIECVEYLISLADEVCDSESDLEQVEEALIKSGTLAIEPILKKLENSKSGNAEKMLLYVLALAGSDKKDERIYQRLRDAFRSNDDKLPVVICFGVYNDSRAVTVLRGFLNRDRHNINQSLLYEIIGTIRKLGGTTDDFY